MSKEGSNDQFVLNKFIIPSGIIDIMPVLITMKQNDVGKGFTYKNKHCQYANHYYNSWRESWFHH